MLGHTTRLANRSAREPKLTRGEAWALSDKRLTYRPLRALAKALGKNF
jgi:hypothetical protein